MIDQEKKINTSTMQRAPAKQQKAIQQENNLIQHLNKEI